MAAASGVTGARDILEGEAGFGAAMSEGAKWERALEGLGERYNITRITQKNHGCCGHAFAAIDAALELRPRVKIADIERIEVRGYKATLDVAGIREPRTAAEAKFSTPYLIAHALIHGSVRLNAFDEDRLNDPAIRSLLRKVTLVEDPALTASFPNQRAARVAIVTARGERLEHFAPYRKGDPEAPLEDAEIDAKFMELVAPVLGEAPSRGLLAQLWKLETLDGLPALR
jgi:2-methylcitrate dehydratase PrpD